MVWVLLAQGEGTLPDAPQGFRRGVVFVDRDGQACLVW
jgi:hypothetical protein